MVILSTHAWHFNEQWVNLLSRDAQCSSGQSLGLQAELRMKSEGTVDIKGVMCLNQLVIHGLLSTV